MSDLSTMKGREVSDPGTRMGTMTDEDKLDQLVQQASVPNLAALVRKGKKQGLIQPQQEYGHTT